MHKNIKDQQRDSFIRFVPTMPEVAADESEVDSEIFNGGFIGDN